MGIPLRTRAFWTVYRVLDRAPVMQQSPERVRRASDRRKMLLGLPGVGVITGFVPRGVEQEDRTFTASDGAELAVRIYRPAGVTGRSLPAVVNFHGGGWVSGDIRQSQWWCASIARDAGVAVVSVEYRLAPEHRFPVPLHDCYDATAWVAANAAELGIDAERVGVMGDSAGGNLAAAVAILARDRGGPRLALQVLIYPSVDLGADYPSKDENAHAPILSRKDVDTTWLMYVPEGHDPKDPLASPLFADHHDLPRALIQTAQYDPLRDQGPVYAQALRDAGVEVRLTQYVGAVHGYASLPGIAPAAAQALAEVVATVRDALGS